MNQKTIQPAGIYCSHMDTLPGNESALLATFAAQTTLDHLPPSALEDTHRTILDWLGSALAGSIEPQARMAQRLAQTLGRSEEATVFSAGRSSAAGAALANGVASHILELDDIHKGSTVHGAAPIIPAALAVAEREGASGADFLLAVALGYEAALRIGEAVNPSHYRHWHPTGTVATFGAAVAAGKLLGLDASAMLHALGSAGTQAAGLWEFNADGAMSKTLHPGKAAMNGVFSADLARMGFSGASRILEGPRGFMAATSQNPDLSRITDRLGQIWKISENGYKIHACCGHTHTAIDAALELRPQLSPSQIQSIHLETYGPGWAIVSEMNPRTPYQGKFSLAYGVCAALCHGRVGLEQFPPEWFGPQGVVEPQIAALLPRVSVTVSPRLTSMYPGAWPARLQIELTDGRLLAAGGDFPRGNAENPVSTAALEDKFRGLVEPRLGSEQTRRALDWIHHLLDLPNLAQERIR
jgi:2-methylcitrate dehydratase PrpD